MVGGTADCRVDFLESRVASGPARVADLVVVHRVLWMVGWMDIGWAGAMSVFGVGPRAGLLVEEVAPEAAV